MKSRSIVSVLLLAGALGAIAVLPNGAVATPVRQWATINLSTPTMVAGKFLMGQYQVEHDMAAMDRGEPCTTFYHVDPRTGLRERVLSFLCTPTERPIPDRHTLTVRRPRNTPFPAYVVLTEYQFRADPEGHGIPTP